MTSHSSGGPGDLHPWLRVPLTSVATFPPTERLLTFLAATSAAGDLDGIRRDWGHLPKDLHGAGLEIVLQNILFVGFPRVINALTAIKEMGIATAGAPDAGDVDTWLSSGERLCATVYGDAYERLRASMERLHPALERWMIEIGYGRVLSRPGVSPRLRELCVVAVLAGQDAPRQLESHLRGAQRVGASLEECDAVIGQTEMVWGPRAAQEARTVWLRILDDAPR